MWSDLLTRNWLSLHSLLVTLGLFIYVTASHTLHQRRHPAAAVAWVLALALLPYVALPLYLLFGSRKVVRALPLSLAHSSALRTHASLAPVDALRQLTAAMGLPVASAYEHLNIHADGEQALQALHKVIDGALRTLDICTFILGRDRVGEEIAHALVRRAREGVRVRLLIDGVGLYLGGRPNLERLRAAGIEIVQFVPPWQSPLRGRTNLRNHRKMIIADGRWLWTGGRNLAVAYFEGGVAVGKARAVWRDLTFDLQGALAGQAQQQFELDWRFAARTPALPIEPPETSAGTVPSVLAQLVPSGPDQVDDTVHALLVSACFNARTRIVAATPYFVPDPTLLMALTLAARRGVEVDLLLPRHSNHLLADVARHRALRDLAVAGAKVWLLPTMMHAKAVVVDDALALVGSANLDARSLFLNYELMIAFYDRADVQRFEQWIDAQRDEALPYRPRPPGLLRRLGEGLVLWLAFQL